MPTILLVEDDARSRELTAKLLRAEGYDVLRASDGRDALALLKTCNVELALLDVLMPGMDGMHFLREIRSLPRWERLPVIMLTGVADAAIMHSAHRLGVRDFLLKARYSPSDLLDCIRENFSQAPLPVTWTPDVAEDASFKTAP